MYTVYMIVFYSIIQYFNKKNSLTIFNRVSSTATEHKLGEPGIPHLCVSLFNT